MSVKQRDNRPDDDYNDEFFVPGISIGDPGASDNSEEEDNGEDEGKAGNEDENEMAADLRNVFYNRWAGRREYKDTRTWKKRITQTEKNWAPILPLLADTYLEWQNSTSPPVSSTPHSPVSADSDQFVIDVIDIYNLAREVNITTKPDEGRVISIARAGYLATTPTYPSLAISFRTLELYRVLRLFKPSLSVEAFAKVLCHEYMIPYRRGYRTALGDAFELYLTIKRDINNRVAEVLGHNTPNHRVLNACPPCSYQLEDEPPLVFSRMLVMDGNNLLKRSKGFFGRQVADTRTFTASDYFLPEDFVNQFANEVKSSATNTPPAPPINTETNDITPGDNAVVPQPSDANPEEHSVPGDSNADPTDDGDDNGDPTDGADAGVYSTCTQNWKAAGDDSKKRMWDSFHESGLFASCCRHGFILWLVDQIRSGELAKYPLAIIAKALDVIGEDWIMGYDIGCAFTSTTDKSSLGSKFKEKGCRLCVNAFHGYSHDAECQRVHHPINILGMGLEDLETLERVFSSSNQLAAVTRFASSFRRRMYIDLFFQHWDREKYQALGTMLYNNYVQALDILRQDGESLKADLAHLQLTEADLDRYFDDEAKHMRELGRETDEDLHAIAYVELLIKHRDVNAAVEAADSKFRMQIPKDYQFIAPDKSYSQELSQTRKLETQRKVLTEERARLSFEIANMEDAMNIPQRWEPSSKEYQATLKYMKECQYRRKLEHLQKLVVWRLFELHKMNVSQTGYRMRSHIAKALQRRSKAIRKAVAAYNTAAKDIGRPTLDWNQVTHYTFLDQFNILRDTRHAVFDKAWAKPVIRNLMKRYRRVTRAQEEVFRLNVEVRRLHTAVVDENQRFPTILKGCEGTAIYGAVNEYIQRRKAVNRILLERVNDIYELDGFTGNRGPGRRNGASDALDEEMRAPLDPDVTAVPELDDSEGDDDFEDEVGRVVDFMSAVL
ncbi:hypothetical protein VNI00_007301 [Paramarasmius palmivorus]|uniref:CxC2-like cysteine cluster KDZ transposase-associated domain-containing protein n=1 Tax=Paramarasmius palmivorus TaxID=297713 RepID=A0AAW0D6D3_9AGAR